MPIITDQPETPSPAGMTDEVIRSWWGTVPASAYGAVTERLRHLDAESPDLVAAIRRVTGLPG